MAKGKGSTSRVPGKGAGTIYQRTRPRAGNGAQPDTSFEKDLWEAAVAR